MRVVIQRVSRAKVIVNESTVGVIGPGLLLFLGVSRADSMEDVSYLLDKVLWLRIFTDENGKMNRNVQESGGSVLVVSQFTLYADCRKGRRPSFDQAAPPEQARALYEQFVESARRTAVPVQTGEFQAMMEVHLVNEGPVTIMLDSADRKRS
jgi:D-tyrosyl-tRNA(Tyr) deacylase